jgi:hypothetical protein
MVLILKQAGAGPLSKSFNRFVYTFITWYLIKAVNIIMATMKNITYCLMAMLELWRRRETAQRENIYGIIELAQKKT